MARVNINGVTHQVEVEHDGTLAEATRVARKLYRQTAPKGRGAGPAVGFTAERGTQTLHGCDADGK